MRMPVVFLGHGSPMNAVDDNACSRRWEQLGQELPRPKAILCISAHWYTHGSRIAVAEHPQTIHDFYGFPDELYDIRYDAPGAPILAREVMKLLPDAQPDPVWGLDHGAWSLLRRMYPHADIPVCQLSIDSSASAQDYYDTGSRLSPLREKGVLILGSGNVVHHLGMVDFSMEGGYSWAVAFDRLIKDAILSRDHNRIISFEDPSRLPSPAFPTSEHYDPLLYILGASQEDDKVTVLNEVCQYGSLSMTSYLFE